MTSVWKETPIKSQAEKDIEGVRVLFIVFQLPLSLTQGGLTLSLLIRSISSSQTRIYHFHLWIAICLASGLAWATATISIFASKTLYMRNIPSRTVTWLLRALHMLWLLWLVVAILLATTPTSCQNISYCAHHRAVMAFSIIICILAVPSAFSLSFDVHWVSYNQPRIPGGGHASENEAPLANSPTKTVSSQNPVGPMDGPVEEDLKGCSEKHEPQMEFADLEKGHDHCITCKRRLDGA